MTLILDASASDPETVHRTKERKSQTLLTYCGQEIPFASARHPRRPGLPKCRRCFSYYKRNLGQTLESAIAWRNHEA